MGRIGDSDNSEGKESSDAVEKYASDGSEGSEAIEGISMLNDGKITENYKYFALDLVLEKRETPFHVFNI